MLIFPINTFLEQHTTVSGCHNIISTCATLEVLDKHRYDTVGTRSGRGSIDSIYGLVAAILSLSLQLHFNRLKTKLDVCHAPFGINCTACSRKSARDSCWGCLAPNTAVTPSHNTHCIVACYNLKSTQTTVCCNYIREFINLKMT